MTKATGFTVRAVALRDRRLIYAAALLRGLAAGAISVLAAVYLAKRGFPEGEIGLVLSAGMAGVLTGTVYGTYYAERVGRRRSLVALALLAAIGGAALAWSESLATVLLASYAGMLNTQGADRGAAQALEQSILPETTYGTVWPRAGTALTAPRRRSAPSSRPQSASRGTRWYWRRARTPAGSVAA